MRLVVQRVSQADVKIDSKVVGKICRGLLVLLGIHQNDKPGITGRYVDKLVHLRIFEDEFGKMNKNVKEVRGEVLVVSQFTLHADCRKGRRPSFVEAGPPEMAIPIYEKFVREVEEEMGRVQTGVFGASMDVSLVNQGPVTIIIENLI